MNKPCVSLVAAAVVFSVGFFPHADAADSATREGMAVRQLVSDWAAAWQDGDFNEYATYYAVDFKGRFASTEAWREARRARIEGRTDIRIDLGPVLVQFNREDTQIARAIFLQSYRSKTWCDVVEKTLQLVRTQAGWRISGEQASPRTRC